VLLRVWLELALRWWVELEWDLLPSLFFSLANERDEAPNKDNAKMPDMKVRMQTSVFWAPKISA
jgi:hypothetical protein